MQWPALGNASAAKVAGQEEGVLADAGVGTWFLTSAHLSEIGNRERLPQPRKLGGDASSGLAHQNSRAEGFTKASTAQGERLTCLHVRCALHVEKTIYPSFRHLSS